MARYRKVSTRIWNDEKFRALSDDGRLLFFFLLTHPHMTALGAMRASLPGLAAELGWSSARLSKAFKEASERGIAVSDKNACCVLLPNFLKHNPPESPNVIKAWVCALEDIPECNLKTLAIQRAREVAAGMTDGFRKAFESLPEAFSKGMPYQEQEQEQEQEEDSVLPDGSTVVADATREQPKANGLDRGLEQQIIAAYHEELPELPRIRDWTPARHRHLAARVAQVKKRGKPGDTVDYWRGVFRKVAASDFLMGRKKDWRCPGLAWLIESPERFTKLIEGGYANHGRG